MTRSLLFLMLAALPCLALADDAKDADKYLLRYKMELGDVVRYNVVHKAEVRSTIEGSSEKATMLTESTKAWKVIDVLPSGEIELQNVVESVKMKNKIADRAEMTFDSTSKEEPAAGFEDAAKAIGVPLSHIKITAWGDVLDHQVKHHQPAADPYTQLALLLPKEEIAVGESWNEPIEMKVDLSTGGTKVVDTRRHYTLKSVKNGVATISAAFQVLTPVTPEVEGKIAQRMMEGEVRFDVDAGKVLSQEYSVDKRVLGFAGEASSMHYQMKMSEKLLPERADVASRPQ